MTNSIKTKVITYILYICSIICLYIGYGYMSSILTIVGGILTVYIFKNSIVQRIPISGFIGGAFRDRSHLYFKDEIDTVSFAFVANIFASLLIAITVEEIPAPIIINLAAHAVYIIFIIALIVKL